MRTFIFTIMAAAMFAMLPAGQVRAQTVAEIVQDTWSGYTEFEASYLNGGKGSISQSVTISVSGTSISGKMKSIVDLDGSKYVCYSSVSGKIYEDDNQVYFIATVNSGGDVLPYGLEWCGISGTLTLYNDSKRNGYYILKGNTKDDCSGAPVELALSNY